MPRSSSPPALPPLRRSIALRSALARSCQRARRRMVDLVKIRKKKAEKKAADVIPTPSSSEGEGPGREVAPQTSPEPTAAAAPPEPQVPPSGRDDTAAQISKLEKF